MNAFPKLLHCDEESFGGRSSSPVEHMRAQSVPS